MQTQEACFGMVLVWTADSSASAINYVNLTNTNESGTILQIPAQSSKDLMS